MTTTTKTPTLTASRIAAASADTALTLAAAIDGHDGFRATVADSTVYVSRSGRRMGTIVADYDGDESIEVEAFLIGCRGGINALCRNAGVVDSYWQLADQAIR